MKHLSTEWDLTLLYESLSDKNIERDISRTERAYNKFNKDFNKSDKWLKNPKELLKALESYEALSELPGEKALMYAVYRRELDSSLSRADALIMQLQDRLTKAGTKVMFFENRLSKISKQQQRLFLKDTDLKKYKYYLQRLFLEGKHTLAESEERVLALTSAPRSMLWVSGVEKLVNKQIIKLGKESLPINDVLSKVPNMTNATKRRAWWKVIISALEDISDFPESEINALCTDKKVSDELRGFKNPQDATILHYENNKKSIEALVNTVINNYDIAHEFMRVKKQMTGLSELHYVDRMAPIGTSKKRVSYQDATEIVRKAYYEISDTYGDIITDLVHGGNIDVYPKVGKSGGAYCSSGINMPTYVLLNHTNDLNSLYTLAHELGHATHSARSKQQPTVYQDYSIAVAETASTFFERVAFDKIYESLNEREKIIALHNKIQDDITTIFRQIAFYNFEYDLHMAVRKQGWVSKGEIANLLAEHLRAYLGDAVKVNDSDGYSFVYIGHFRNYFYVYTYAFGQLISRALFENYKKDKSYISKIDTFLSAGGSATPEQIFKKVGIDVTKPEFWQQGLDAIRSDINKLKRLIK